MPRKFIDNRHLKFVMLIRKRQHIFLLSFVNNIKNFKWVPVVNKGIGIKQKRKEKFMFKYIKDN